MMFSEVTGTELKEGFRGYQALCEAVSLQSVKCSIFKEGKVHIMGLEMFTPQTTDWGVNMFNLILVQTNKKFGLRWFQQKSSTEQLKTLSGLF